MEYEDLKKDIRQFCEERDWGKFHTPENLAKSIAIESGELLECFQWNGSEFDRRHVNEELADVFIYCLQMADAVDADMLTIAAEKMKKNRAKYPVEKARGNAVKYDKL